MGSSWRRHLEVALDYWVRTPGNSGISIRDPTRAKYSLTIPPDYSKTPSKVGYEIQINSQWPDKNPTGSIYGLAFGKIGAQRDGEWNTMNIESRKDQIRVLIKGIVVEEIRSARRRDRSDYSCTTKPA